MKKFNPKTDQQYRQIWRIVDGAVSDAFSCHPDYLTEKGLEHARNSVVKRVSGALKGYVVEKSKRKADPSDCDGLAAI